MSQQYPPMPGGYGYQQPLGTTDPNNLNLPLYGATFGQAVSRYFKKYAVFTGRASRSEYWWVQLFLFLVSLVPLLLMGLAAGSMVGTEVTDYVDYGSEVAVAVTTNASPLFIFATALGLVMALAFVIPSLALAWRRLHDANLPGPFWFLSWIPGVGSVILLVMTLLPSNPAGIRFDRGA